MAAFVEEVQEGAAQIVAGLGFRHCGIARWAGSYGLRFVGGEPVKGTSL